MNPRSLKFQAHQQGNKKEIRDSLSNEIMNSYDSQNSGNQHAPTVVKSEAPLNLVVDYRAAFAKIGRTNCAIDSRSNFCSRTISI